MKPFVKDNLAIIAAIVLPLILIALFGLSTLVVRQMVADPEYDFLIATNYYGGSNEAFYFDVVQNRLQISYTYPVKVNGTFQNANISRLWRVRVPAMTVEEIALVPPGNRDGADGQRVPVDIPGVSNLQMISTQPAPDGYAFQQSYDRYYGGGLMREVFGGGSRGANVSAIVKDGRAVPIRNLGGAPYSGYEARFIGWIAKGQ